MKLFNLFKKKDEVENRNIYSDSLLFNSYSSFSSSYSMKISAVYRAVHLISDSIAMLPINVQFVDSNGYKDTDFLHHVSRLFQKEPNPNMTTFQLIKLLLIDVMISGNGYAYIERNGSGEVMNIHYLHPSDVVTEYNYHNKNLKYKVRGYNNVEPCNMLHFVKHTVDGVNGISVLSNAANTIQLTYDTERQAHNFFKSGCALSGILKVNGQLQEKQKEQIRNSWNNAYNSDNGGGLAVIQGNMDYQQISVNAADSQLLESRNFQISDIARFFGISPVLLGDLSNSSYSTLEQSQLQFLSQTLQPYIVMLEEEFSRKLFLPSEMNYRININERDLIKTDKQALASYYVQLLQNGLMTPNEIRKELGYSGIEGGDKTVMQAQYLQQNKNNLTQNKEEVKEQMKEDGKE